MRGRVRTVGLLAIGLAVGGVTGAVTASGGALEPPPRILDDRTLVAEVKLPS